MSEDKGKQKTTSQTPQRQKPPIDGDTTGDSSRSAITGVSIFEALFEGLEHSPLYGPLVAPAIRKRQFERRDLQRKEEIVQAEHERKLAEIRAGTPTPEPQSCGESSRPLHGGPT